jgi:hypothetical protein
MLGILENYIADVTKSIETPLDITDVQYGQEFEAIENEIQKLQNVVPQQPNWQLMITNGKTILTTQGKHLKVITYVTVALYNKYKIGGLLAGLYLLADILKSEKDAIMPHGKRKKSRINLITWMVKFIADYREKNPQDLPLKDLDNIQQAKADVIEWFDTNHPDDDSLALLQIYDWFINAKKTLEYEKQQQEQQALDAQQQSEQNEVAVIEIEEEEIVETTIIQSQKPSQPIFVDSAAQIIPTKKVEVKSFAGAREFLVQELLARLAIVKDNPEELFVLMSQARKVVWNTVYYEDLSRELIQIDISPDFVELNQILCISDPVVRIGELERLFIKNPFLLDIQMYIVQALEDSYMRSGDTGFKKIKDFIVSELTFLIAQLPKIFDLSYGNRKCTPEYIYDWVFTQLVDDYEVIRSILEEYLVSYDADLRHVKLLEYTNNARSMNVKMGFLLDACGSSYLDDHSKIVIAEKFLNDDDLIKELMSKNAGLKEALKSLYGFYETYIARAEDTSLIARKKEISRKIQL